MPMLKRNLEPNASATPSPRGRSAPTPPGELVTSATRAVFIESPARLLHEQLAARLEAADAITDTRWPGAVRVGIIVGSSLALWAVAIAAATALTA